MASPIDLPEEPQRVDRRRVLGLAAAAAAGLAGTAALVGCGDDGEAATASTTTAANATTTVATTAGASGMSGPGGTPPGPPPGNGAGGGGTAGGGSTPTDESGGECAPTPSETAGPYPGDGSNGPDVLAQDGVVRHDISASFGSSTTTAPGIPATINLTLLDNGNGCKPLAGAAVYLWHCDADGNYSMYSDGVTEENYLRGVQVADDSGKLSFTTVFPGCYSGRWPHIHYEVYANAADAVAGTSILRTSQIAVPQAICETVYADKATYPSSAQNLGQLTLASDNVFGDDSGASQLATTTGDAKSVTINATANI